MIRAKTENIRVPVDVRGSKTSVFKLPSSIFLWPPLLYISPKITLGCSLPCEPDTFTTGDGVCILGCAAAAVAKGRTEWSKLISSPIPIPGN